MADDEEPQYHLSPTDTSEGFELASPANPPQWLTIRRGSSVPKPPPTGSPPLLRPPRATPPRRVHSSPMDMRDDVPMARDEPPVGPEPLPLGLPEVDEEEEEILVEPPIPPLPANLDRLHILCARAQSASDLWSDDDLNATVAASNNVLGQTPLHVLSQNCALNPHDVLPRVLELVQTYPAAMMTPDADGFIPFQRLLVDWVQESHDRSHTRAVPRNSIAALWIPSNRVFPADVEWTPASHYAVTLVSAILDALDQKMEKIVVAAQEEEEDDDNQSLRSVTETLRHLTVQDLGTEIVQSMASIPNFVKTLFLMDDREDVLHTTLVRRILACPQSVGPWLPHMLQSDQKRVSDAAMDFLKHLTDDDVHQEVCRLDDFVPSIMALPEEDIEDISTTAVVQKVLDDIISRGFCVTIVFCDAFFLGLLIFGFRGASNRVVLGHPPEAILRYVYVANTGIFYFLIRELGKAVSLCMITQRSRLYFWSFWNLSDLMATLLALVSMLVIRSNLDVENIHRMRGLRQTLAIATGFLWLRVLNYLKGINMQLATFVLAILQVRFVVCA